MFTQFFFLLLCLILVSFMPKGSGHFWVNQPQTAFALGLVFYLFTLGLIYIQAKILKRFRKRSNGPLLLALTELLLFLCLYQFGFGSQRLLLEYAFSASASIFSLLLYLAGLGWTFYAITQDASYAREQVRFVLPLCIPFLFFDLLYDCFSQLNLSPFIQEYFDIPLNFLLLGATLVYMPFVLTKCWRCQPIKDAELLSRLEEVCRQLRFKHAGMKIWTVMRHAFTAGIIGVAPRFRYIMFTERLLQQLQSEEIEAVLIHEIGHNRHRHLLFYPFILMGMLLSAYLLFQFILEPFLDKLKPAYFAQDQFFITHTLLFLLYAAVLGIYFRFIFGFFSRLFERQADLHIFETSLSPSLMIQALDRIAVLSGGIHRQPSWHHFSVQERIQFLDAAIRDPRLVGRHHARVKWWLWTYFIFLGIGGLILISERLSA